MPAGIGIDNGSTEKIVLYAVLSSDHITPATGKTIAVTISKNGAAFGNPSGGATNATEIGNGWYYFTPSGTDTGTNGPLIVRGAAATIDDSTRDFMVAAAASTAPTAAQVAAAVWQDTTSGDFTVSGSIGKSLFTGGAVPGAAGGHFIAGTNAATTVTTSFTTTFTGNLTGSVGSVASSVEVGSIDGPALAQFFTDDTGSLYADAVTGSVVKEIASNSTGGGGTSDVNVISIAANVITATSIASGALNGKGDWLTSLGTHPPTDWINAASIAAAALNGKGDWSTLTASGVWAAGTRTLTAGTNIVLVKGVGVTGFTDLDAAGIRTAVGLASANLDTQLATIPTTAGIADKFLGRNIAGGSDGGRTVKEAMAFLRNKWTIAGGTLTVYATNDSSALWTASVTTTAGDNVTTVDPS